MKIDFILFLISFVILCAGIVQNERGVLTDRLCFLQKHDNKENPKDWILQRKLNIVNGTIQKILDTNEGTYFCARFHQNKAAKLADKEDPIIREVREDSHVSWAVQETIHKRVAKTADTEWNNLWHLNGDVSPSMKVSEAWAAGFNGSGILVAILDDGIQTDHSDYNANVNTANDYDYVDDDDDPSPAFGDSHGTNVAGFIAAEINNNDCTVGVAYESTILGVRILGGSGLTDSEEALALKQHSPNVAIYSNSWGPIDGYGFSGPGPMTIAALQNEVQNGRGGKGAIYTWASGNGQTSDNCNGDGYTNSIYTIGITSVHIGQTTASYSEVCAAAMAATYGGATSRSLTTTTTSSGCTSDGIQGTSFSTPIASGIIALTLQANPALTWRDVQHLIVLTSTKNGFTVTYSSWSTNGKGKEFSQVLGFGLMDAEAMVTQAQTWTLVPAQQTCNIASKTGAGSTSGSSVSTDTQTIQSSDCSAITFLEHVTVEIDFSYSRYRGVTEFTLRSPSGSESHLMHYRYDDAVQFSSSGSLTWTFMSVHFWRETPIGTWTLKFSSNSGLSTVTVNSWALTFFGTTTDPLPNIDLCTSDPCQNNGTCINNAYSYNCQCGSDYTGSTCETAVSADSNSSVLIIVFGVIGAIIALAIVICLCCILSGKMKGRKKERRVHPRTNSKPSTNIQSNPPNHHTFNNSPMNHNLINSPMNHTLNNLLNNDALNSSPINPTLNNSPMSHTLNNSLNNHALNNSPINPTLNNSPIDPTLNNSLNNYTLNNLLNNHVLNNSPINHTLNDSPINRTLVDSPINHNNSSINPTLNDSPINHSQ